MQKLLLVWVFLLASVALAFSQERTVTGKVTSREDGSGIPGVNVLLKGTTSGTVTDATGSYAIRVNGDGVLVFSFIGLQTQEIAVGSRSAIDVTMESDATQLGEVVVVGYGVQKKEALTGSVGVVESKKLEQINTSTFENALQGALSGVQVNSNDGAPGSNTQIRIRGIGSITASNDPLYVVDGIPVTTGSVSQTDFGNGGRSSNVMAGLNPNDIESVTVLKDASATAIYGSRGANGVIVITTKSGKSGAPVIDFKTFVGVNSPASKNLLKPLNADQYRELFAEGYKNRPTPWTDAQIDNQFNTWYPKPANTNWIDAVTRNGVTQSYDLSARGGSDHHRYFASVAYFDQQGHIIGNEIERLSTRFKIEFDLSKKLTVTNNITASRFNQRGITDGTRWQAPMYNGILLAPVIPIRDDQGRFYGDHANFFMGGNNPVGHLSGDDARELAQSRIIDNLTATYKITDDLAFKTAWSLDIINIDEYIFSNRRYGDGRNSNGFAEEAATFDNNWIGTQTLNYSKTLSQKHNLDVLLGYEAQKSNRRSKYGYGENFPSERLRYLASAASAFQASSDLTEYAFTSTFSRLTYDYDGRYYASFSLRRDGSSRFGANKRYGNFWSVGASWVVSQESFFSGTLVNLLKLRTSYGVVGNAGIGNFPSLGLYEFGVNYDGDPGSIPSQIANPNLTWESQESFNVGLDFGLINNRLSGTVEYFDRNSTDLILDRPVTRTSGFEDVTQNVGDMRNKGWEVGLSATIVQSNGFSWTLGNNITFLKNEITRLDEPIVDDTKRREQGRDFQEYWLFGWAGVDPANGDPLWFKDETKAEKTNDINEAVRFYDGKSATPDFYGGVSSSFSYRNFTLDLQVNYQFGNYIYDAPGWVYHGDGRFTPRSTSTYAFENRWKQPGDEALFPKFIWGGNQASNTQNSSRYLYDGSYIRLRNVQFSYLLPNSLLDRFSLRSVRVYVRLNNIATWTRDKDLFLDPEQAINGVANSVTPQIRTAALGIDIGL